MVARAGVAAKFTFLVHSHMLRHACGFKLANDGHDTRVIQAYLGHRSIMSTVRYTALTLTANRRHLAGSFNYLVCAVEQRRRHGEAERLGGRKIDHKRELSLRLNRQVRGISTL
jgi:hypothetical protein